MEIEKLFYFKNQRYAFNSLMFSFWYMPETILVLCAHSDDQIFGVGGTLAKYAKQGKIIKTVIFSYGEQSHPWLKSKVTIQMRVKESYDADKVIGGHGVEFLNLADGKIAQEAKEKNIHHKLCVMMRKLKPSKIFTHSEDDAHPDHRAVSSLVLRAFDSVKPNAHVYTFDVWSPVKVKERHHPQLVVPISDTFQIKLKALRCFKSQWAAMVMLLWSVYVRAIKNGLFHHGGLAEKFSMVR